MIFYPAAFSRMSATFGLSGIHIYLLRSPDKVKTGIQFVCGLFLEFFSLVESLSLVLLR